MTATGGRRSRRSSARSAPRRSAKWKASSNSSVVRSSATIGHQTVGRARAAMSEMVVTRSEQLRQEALALVRAGDLERALDVYDSAMAETDDDELRELITINKADALVALERGGPEVQALPTILMRRRNPRHTFLASYALLYKCRISRETKRAIFYGHIAHETAVAAQ